MPLLKLLDHPVISTDRQQSPAVPKSPCQFRKAAEDVKFL